MRHVTPASSREASDEKTVTNRYGLRAGLRLAQPSGAFAVTYAWDAAGRSSVVDGPAGTITYGSRVLPTAPPPLALPRSAGGQPDCAASQGAAVPAPPPATPQRGPTDSAGQPAHSRRFATDRALDSRVSVWSAAACCRFSAPGGTAYRAVLGGNLPLTPDLQADQQDWDVSSRTGTAGRALSPAYPAPGRLLMAKPFCSGRKPTQRHLATWSAKRQQS